MAVIGSWDLPGNDGDYFYLPALANLASGFRTGAGFPARTVIVVASYDALPNGDFVVFNFKRASNDGINHGLWIDGTNDRIRYVYNASAVAASSSSVVATATHYAFCYCDPGNGGNITVRLIPLSTATQSASATAASGGSVNDDQQTQQIEIGGYESGGTVNGESNAQVSLILVIDGTALSQAQCEAFAADPLTEGDELCQTHGTNAWFWDDSGTDVGDNNAGAPTLAGGVTRSSSGGPDVPARDIPEPTNSPSITSVGSYNIIYNGEQRITITGANFGTTSGIVGITTDPLGGDQVTQDINSWSATSISFNCSLGSITPGQRYLFVTNQTVGTDFGQDGSMSISVQADPGAEVIALRQTPTPINLQASTPVSVNLGALFYKRDAQGSLTFSATGLPTGLSIVAASGIIFGFPTAAANFTPEITATDDNGDSATQSFSWGISAAPVAGSGSFRPRVGYPRRASRRSF